MMRPSVINLPFCSSSAFASCPSWQFGSRGHAGFGLLSQNVTRPKPDLNVQNAGGTNRARIGRSDSYEPCSRQISVLAEADHQMQTTRSRRASSQAAKGDGAK